MKNVYRDGERSPNLTVKPYLHAGENRLCIVGYCPVSSSFCYRRGAPGLRFAVYGGESLLAASGTETLCLSIIP